VFETEQKRILVGCEFSGRVRDAFKKQGWDAWSCDLLPSETKGQHIQDDVLKHLNDGWDLAIFHPPCTHLAVSGAAWFYKKKTKQKQALAFIRKLLNAPIERIALENPVGIISTKIRKPDQIIQPWMFGESYSKKTCLWLKNLPLLKPTKIVDKGEYIKFKSGRTMPKWYAEKWGDGHSRSITFKGIAVAMATQWKAVGLPPDLEIPPQPKGRGFLSVS
jgi:hypothetical protein